MTSADVIRDLQKLQKKELEEMKKAVQTSCPHLNVLHDAGFTSYGTYHPKRRCVDCGYTEIGGWWSYSVDTKCWHDRDDFNKKVLNSKEGRTIREVSEEEFCRAAV